MQFLYIDNGFIEFFVFNWFICCVDQFDWCQYFQCFIYIVGYSLIGKVGILYLIEMLDILKKWEVCWGVCDVIIGWFVQIKFECDIGDLVDGIDMVLVFFYGVIFWGVGIFGKVFDVICKGLYVLVEFGFLLLIFVCNLSCKVVLFEWVDQGFEYGCCYGGNKFIVFGIR